MDVNTAVKDKENYGAIVRWFRSQVPLTMDQLVCLVDTIQIMSEEVFEHYHGLQTICRQEIKQINDITSMTKEQKKQLKHVIKKACDLRILLREKYENLIAELEEEQ